MNNSFMNGMNGMNGMNNGFNSMNNPSWQSYPSQVVTNTSFVTGLEEALFKSNVRGSDVIHFNQDKPEFYRIKVDQDGRKTWQAFQYNVPAQDESVPATKADIQGLLARIEALENKSREVVPNAESNG